MFAGERECPEKLELDDSERCFDLGT